MQRITEKEIAALAVSYGLEYGALRAVIDVEAAGRGFDPETGKILIQFEPIWFKRKFADWKKNVAGHKWATNTVGVQSVEWTAFNDAFGIDKNAAMESTSIGMMQVMGYHWELLGFASVGEMWDFAKVSEGNQVQIGIRFIMAKGNERMLAALKAHDWKTFAYLYNGKNYLQFKYDTRLAAAAKKYPKFLA